MEIKDNLYSNDKYLENHPNLHTEDSPWKIQKIIPLLDIFMTQNTKKEINLLDVGGGSGVILKEVCEYLRNKYPIKINKYLLDLSPGILEIQKKNNPDLKMALNENISNTSLGDKEIDITLMIDVLEHVPQPSEVLRELNRISNFVLFKVPLDNNTYYNILTLLTRNRLRNAEIQNLGHLQHYNSKTLKSELKPYSKEILCYQYTNYPEFVLNGLKGRNMDIKEWIPDKIIYSIASMFYRISPQISSKLFSDFAMILIKC